MQKINISLHKERIKELSDRLKEKGLIHNEILGYASQEEIRKCVIENIIIFKSGRYFIPMEKKLIAKQGGVLLRSPQKVWVVSEKYLNYMRKTGRIKQNA